MGRRTRTSSLGRRRAWLVASAVALTGASGISAAHASESAPSASRPDFDADGSNDLVVGVPKDSSSRGSVTLLPGSASGPDAAARKTLTRGSPGLPGADARPATASAPPPPPATATATAASTWSSASPTPPSPRHIPAARSPPCSDAPASP